jgi:hypothetical protein
VKGICDHASQWCKQDCEHRRAHTIRFDCETNFCHVSGRPGTAEYPNGHLVECREWEPRPKRAKSLEVRNGHNNG